MNWSAHTLTLTSHDLNAFDASIKVYFFLYLYTHLINTMQNQLDLHL